ncbi:MAG: hypothetical protein RLZZ293_449 [Pseudomonadota bacterium]|jgi:oligopeptidase A
MNKFFQFDQLNLSSLADSLTEQLHLSQNLVNNLAQIPTSSWESIMQPLQEQLYQLNQYWGIIAHLHSVQNTPQIRQLHEQFLPQITELYVNLGQNQDLYQHLQTIKQQYTQLTPVQQKVIDNELRDFKLSGISLAKEQQQQFKQIENQLSELSSKFNHNLLDSTDNYFRDANLAELSGVPEDSLQLYQSLATQANSNSEYRISLHMPSYLPIMQYCDNQQLREEIYYAYATRASELNLAGKFDNSSVIKEILQLRHAKASLLGFNNYAELSLATKMGDNAQQVLDFLYQLANKARPYALADLTELTEFAQQQANITQLQAWDLAYFSEKLQQHKYSYSSHELKQYFPLTKVNNGLFALIKQLYNIEFVINPNIPTWHNDVIVYDVLNQQQVIGHLYFDLYAREGKQSGAWMNSAQDRYQLPTQLYLPIAYIVCNFTKPLVSQPSLLSFDEVQTLFHEMGHALHHLLTTQDNPNIAGINGVEWDAVELPSQFMENFTWDYTILSSLSEHVQTGAQLPLELFNKLLASRHFQVGLQMLRQLEFAIYDLCLHSQFKPNQDDYQTLLNSIRQQIAVIQPPHYNRFTNSFAHIFAGGYAAGYYSYKWAEVLACDVFSQFEGLSGEQLSALGAKFCTKILSRGGINPMMKNVTEFLGREPQIDALLKYSGISN